MKNKVIMFRCREDVFNKVRAVADMYYQGNMSKMMSSLVEKYFIIGDN